jgi:hypothetical protein
MVTVNPQHVERAPMKIAVYSIAKNEVHEVKGWEETTRGADFRLLLDTGSTDGTDTEMEKHKDVTVHRGVVRPWRFDDARNAALCFVPADVDICISLDMDERLRAATPGISWRDAVIAAWTPETTMLRCAMNSGGRIYYSYRIHRRFGYRWRHPVHEILDWRGQGQAVDTMTDDLIIDHLPTLEKPRPPHRHMLVEAIAEAPNDARIALQYGWQLVVEGEREQGIAELNRYLHLSVKTGLEAAFVHRLIAQYDPDHFLEHMERAELAHPATSNQVALAAYYRDREMWDRCYAACQAAIARERMRPAKVGHWGDDERIATPFLHDTASSSAWMMWDFEASYGHAVEAYRRSPDASRRENVKRIKDHIVGGATLENMAAPISSMGAENLLYSATWVRGRLAMKAQPEQPSVYTAANEAA